MPTVKKQTSRWIAVIEKLFNIAIIASAVVLIGALASRYLSSERTRPQPETSPSVNKASSDPDPQQNVARQVELAVASPTAVPLPTPLTAPMIDLNYESVTEDQVLRALKAGQRVVILDVRDRADFAAKHLTGARNIPVDEIEVRAENELSSEDLIALYCGCKDDAGNKVAQKILGLQGFKRITFLHDGSEHCDTCP